jgi:DnaK suppressor protein
MNAQEMDRYRHQLFALGERLHNTMSELTGEALRQSGGEASGQLSNTPLHMADLGSDNFEQSVAVSLLQNERAVLGEISAALSRIDAGTFGRCIQCGRDIPTDRLEAIPYASHCIRCARQQEVETGDRQSPRQESD